jgi:hypothetical protein
MNYVFALACVLLMASILRAEDISLTPKPIPAPTTMRVAMDMEQGESLSSKGAKEELKYLAAELKQEKEIRAYILCSEKSERSKAACKTANQIKNYLVKKEGIESERIIVVVGGISDIWKIRIYLVPPEKTGEDKSEQKLDARKVLDYRTEFISSICLTSTKIKRKTVSKTPAVDTAIYNKRNCFYRK